MKQQIAGVKQVMWTILVVSVLAAACKEDKLSVKIKVTNDNLCSEVAEVRCRNMFECCTGLEIEEILGVKLSTTEEECRTDQRLACEAATSALQYAIDQGHTSLIAANADACLKELLVGDQCFPQVTEFAPACEKSIVQGNQAVGADCLYSFECAEGVYCGADRKCRELADSGDPCGQTAECKTGLYCGVDESDTAATTPVCLELKAAGEECNGSEECQDGTFCLYDEETFVGTCTTLKALGDTCDEDDACESSFCLPGSCGGADVCYSEDDCLGICRDSGLSCAASEDCDGYCETSTTSTCNAERLCNGACETSGFSCYNDMDCDGTCAVSGFTCYDNADCDMTDSADTCELETCVPAETCIQDDVCEGASSCDGRVCAENYAEVDYCQIDMLGLF